MSSEKVNPITFGSKVVLEAYSARMLASACPVLGRFLARGLRVLDVGSGPGTITLDVARAVAPGSVVGVDANEKAVSEATRAKEEATLTNVGFRVGDAYSLPFEDGTFDLVYSNGVFDWLSRPVAAIREQGRVTKSGGRVIALVAAPIDRWFYPDCPSILRVLRETRSDGTAAHGGLYFDNAVSHRMMQILVESGLTELSVEVFHSPLETAFPGSEFFEYRYWHTKEVQLGDYRNRTMYKIPVAEGRLTWDVFESALAELEAWHSHPHALFVNPRLYGAGRKA